MVAKNAQLGRPHILRIGSWRRCLFKKQAAVHFIYIYSSFETHPGKSCSGWEAFMTALMKQNSFPFGLIFEIFKANFYCSKVVQPLSVTCRSCMIFLWPFPSPLKRPFIPDFSTPNLLWSIAFTFNLRWSQGISSWMSRWKWTDQWWSDQWVITNPKEYPIFK